MVVGLIAGGDIALRKAVERAEDDGDAAVADLKRIGFYYERYHLSVSRLRAKPYVIEACDTPAIWERQ